MMTYRKGITTTIMEPKMLEETGTNSICRLLTSVLSPLIGNVILFRENCHNTAHCKNGFYCSTTSFGTFYFTKLTDFVAFIFTNLAKMAFALF